MLPIYNAIIVDDEPLLRQHLQGLLEHLWADLNIVATASNGEEAWQLINEHEPDLVFLDIRMPVLDGISLAKRFGSLEKPPLTVFATAYDQHAIEAFDNEAVDYLLKPIDESRLEKTILRLKQQLALLQAGSKSSSEEDQARFQQLLSLMSTEGENSEKLRWIKASKADAIHMLPVEGILYFQAESKYTSVVNHHGEHLIKTPIITLNNSLDSDVFWKIHRNCIVNVNFIEKVERNFAGHMYVYLKDVDIRLIVSRSYQNLFRQM